MTTLDCWLTILSMLLGVCIWTFLGGIITTLLIHLNAASSEYTAKITALNQYMAHRKLPQVSVPAQNRTCCLHGLLKVSGLHALLLAVLQSQHIDVIRHKDGWGLLEAPCKEISADMKEHCGAGTAGETS